MSQPGSSPVRRPRGASVRRPRGAAAILIALAVLLLTACSGSSGGGATRLLHYQRVQANGMVEQLDIHSDGRVEMRHGEVLERLTLSATDLARIKDALAKPIPTGAPEDSLARSLELADGTVVTAPSPDAGTVTALLEQLLNGHMLH